MFVDDPGVLGCARGGRGGGLEFQQQPGSAEARQQIGSAECLGHGHRVYGLTGRIKPADGVEHVCM